MENYLEIIGDIFLLLGAISILTSAIGLIRMEDFFSRSHPAGINDSFSLPLILIGILLQIEPSLVMVKFILLIVFSMITASTASHALTKSAIHDLKPKGKAQKGYKEKLKETYK